MGAIDRYICRTTLVSFLIVLVTITALFWVIQALRYIDLVTSRGQAVFVFVGITSLIIPFLITTIAPIALAVSALHTLNKLSADSELTVMSAAGISTWHLFRAFSWAALVASALVLAIVTYFGPKGLRVLRDQIAKINADVVSNILKPNQITSIQGGVTIFIRERRPDGLIRGVIIDDTRNPVERTTVIADMGAILELDERPVISLQNGILQRQGIKTRDLSMVAFDRYAFDLSQLSVGSQSSQYSPRERYLWELLLPSPTDPLFLKQSKQLRAELHDRILGVLYPPTFMLIALMYFRAPRTNRKGRAYSIAQAAGWIAFLRLIGVISNVLGTSSPLMLWVPYAAVGLVGGFALYLVANEARASALQPRDFGYRATSDM